MNILTRLLRRQWLPIIGTIVIPLLLLIVALLEHRSAQGRRHQELRARAWDELGGGVRGAGNIPVRPTLTDAYRHHVTAALRDVDDVLKEDPSDVRALGIKGLCLVDLDQGIEAASVLRQALAIGGRDATYLMWLGEALLCQDRVPEGIRLLRDAADAAPKDPLKRHALGVALELHGNTQAAETAYRQAATIGSDDPEVYLDFANLLRRECKEADALPMYHKALTIAPDSAAAHVAVGELDLQTGDISAARGEFQEAMALAPSGDDAYRGLAIVALLLGNLDHAAQFISTAMEHDSANYQNDDVAADIAMRRERYDDALRYANECLINAPNDSVCSWRRRLAIAAKTNDQLLAIDAFVALINAAQALPAGACPPVIRTFTASGVNKMLEHSDSEVLRKGAQTQPKSQWGAEDWLGLASYCAFHGKEEEAGAGIEEAILLKPDDAEVTLRGARLHFEMGHLSVSKQLFVRGKWLLTAWPTRKRTVRVAR